MPPRHRLPAIGLVLAAAAPTSGAASAAAHTIEARRDGITLAAPDGARAEFAMRFCVQRTTSDPSPELRPADLGTRYNVVTWRAEDAGGAGLAQVAGDASQVGDGFDPDILQGDAGGRTADVFAAAPRTCVEADGVRPTPDGGHRWTFPEQAGFAIEAVLSPGGDGRALPPALRYTLRAKQPGFYSVAYMGAPSHAPDDADAFFQPLVWTEKRFPDRSYLTLAFRATLPSTLVEHAGQVEGMVVDAAEFPFDPLPVFRNSRFGIALRDPDGRARPMVFAPVLGGPGSQLGAGDEFSFTLRPLVHRGDVTAAYEYAARRLYGFHDYRHNALSSLNRTLERIVDYGMSHWSQFRAEDKGASYETDAPGTVKNVSSLNPLDLALVTDDDAIWRLRAKPVIEYMVSREKYLFTIDEEQKIQFPSYTLKGPAAPVSELAALHRIFRGASPAFLALAEEEYGRSRVRNLDVNERGDTWQNSLALYRATGRRHYLDAAVRGADAYLRERVERPQQAFAGVHGEEPFFWTQFVPDFAALMQLYDVTAERRYLEAAHRAARVFTQFVWFAPAIPDTEVLVNPGGKAPLYGYLAGKGHPQMPAAEERVPGWRLSEIGLTPESSGTSSGHRGIFMTNWAPWLLRIAEHMDDSFLRAVARSAVIGRYTNFPGYHINTARTTIYEKPDYPLRDPKSLSVNSFHFNHVWPMASMLLDYLVSDADARSNGAIRFPAEFIEGYAYLQNRAYGGQVGRFYGHEDAVLWMPKVLLQADSVELNYVTARSEDNTRLYVALMNEADTPVTSTVRLDLARLPGLAGRTLHAADVHGTGDIAIDDGRFQVTVPARGLVAFTVADVGIRPGLQARIMAAGPDSAWRQPMARIDDPAARGMVLDYGESMQHAFVFLEDGKRDFNQVALHWTTGDDAGVIVDEAFPWEFSVPVDDTATRFTWRIEGTRPDGSVTRSRDVDLVR
ncbi:hypothetical protein [Luteimonas suaedae]|uniref:hypothetical protein n=1 Tax=Luteimonas suaedae TaxID=2605430 RepID=UPI0011F021D2|nr:hypothetical protein [Luteimonas suaedae]